jgi:hypothetical protein
MLNPSTLPPRGVFVPTSMLFHSELPSSVLLTWIQLRALAWRGWSTPPMSLPEFASLLGIHPSRLEKHLDHLQSVSALKLRSINSGKLVVSFPQQPPASPEEQPQPLVLSTSSVTNLPLRESSELASYFPHQILGYLTPDDQPATPPTPAMPVSTGEQPGKLLVSLDRSPSLCYQEVT